MAAHDACMRDKIGRPKSSRPTYTSLWIIPILTPLYKLHQWISLHWLGGDVADNVTHRRLYDATTLRGHKNTNCDAVLKYQSRGRNVKRRESMKGKRIDSWRTVVRRCWLRRAFLCRECGTCLAFLVPLRRRWSSCARYCKTRRTTRNRYLHVTTVTTHNWLQRTLAMTTKTIQTNTTWPVLVKFRSATSKCSWRKEEDEEQEDARR